MTTHPNARRTAIAIAAAALLAVTAEPATAQFAGAPALANVNSAGDAANGESGAVSTSADGTLVVFASEADNLVPLDNNGDTDVFLHDTVTGITTRVSVNFQGEEATGDSECPSLSGDGRFVAFASRAWNMVQGGQNLPTQKWEVYLHDRQGPLTIRVSTPTHGGLGTADSGCPRISADGTRVAFTSAASDLVPDDTNGVSDVFVYDVPSGELIRASVADDEAQADWSSDDPVLSADGSVVAFSSFATNLVPGTAAPTSFTQEQIYARDLTAETTELVSRAFLAPVQRPDGWSCCPQISADGSVVLFNSIATNLASDAGWWNPSVRLYLRDRSSGEVEGVEALSLGSGPCGFLPNPLICDPSHSEGAALSADGRFVAFLSGSHALLPENPPMHRDQIYVQDRLTRRLRRVTVDPTGYPVNSYPCGGSSSTLSLSEDGSVLAFVSENAAALDLPNPNGQADRDIVRLDLTCDPTGGSCREISECPDTPLSTCEPADKSRLRIRKNPPLAPRHDRFTWRWVGQSLDGDSEFVDPATGRYQLCVYAGESLHAQMDAAIPEGDPWRSVGKGWKRRDPGAAVELVRLRSGPSRSLITVASKSPAIDIPYLPLDVPHGLTIQLQETTTGRCWESEIPASALRVNRRGEIDEHGILPGDVRADVR